MSATKILSDAFTDALRDGGARARRLAENTVKDAIAVGGEAGARAADAAKGLGETMAEVASGRMSADTGKVVAQRYIDALDAVKGGALEAAQVKAAARAKEGLEIVKDLGFALLKAGAVALASGL